MADVEWLTITLASDVAAIVKVAVAGGSATSSEAVRESLREWAMKRALQLQELTKRLASPHEQDLEFRRSVEFSGGALRGRQIVIVDWIGRQVNTKELADLMPFR